MAKTLNCMLEVRLFGEGRIFADGREVKIASRRWTLPLLAYVLLQRGQPIQRRRIAFALWAEETEETAFVSLRRNLRRLRASLPEADDAPWITVNDESLAWNSSSPCSVDFLDYQTLRADPARLEEAVALYTGDLLEDFFDDWITAERERLRRLYQADLNTLIVTKRSRRAFAEAADFAQRLLQTDPWREDAVRSLMSVRYEGGDAAGALAEYDRFARLLGNEMSTAPMPDTVALRDVIARGEPIFAASEKDTGYAKRAAADAPFVGRESEMRSLRTQWARATSGNGNMHFVCGEAGIGKSRLVAELALLAEAEGGRVIIGTTSWPERTPYQCLSGALRSRLPLVAGVSIAPASLAALAELVLELRSFRQDIPPLVRLDPQREQSRLLDALVQALTALSRPRPLMVILEDLHRAGATTIETIRAIAARLARSHILILATYRPEELTRSHPLNPLVGESEGAITEVRPLRDADVRAIADAILPQESARPEFIETLTHESNGNALFVTELLREIHRTPERVTVPASLQEMIATRLASLGPAARNVAQIAAVAGEAFSVGIVQEIARLRQGVVLDALDELLDRHIISESLGPGNYEYAFTHHLVHAAIYDGSPSAARTRRHRRIAGLLEEAVGNSDERAAEIALHFDRGGEPSKAALQYARAARRAAALYASAEARSLIARALELGEWTNQERFDLLLLSGGMNRNLVDLAAEQTDLAEAELLATKLDANARCAVLEALIRVAFRTGSREDELTAIDRLVHEAAGTPDERWLGVADELRSRLEERSGDLQGSVESALRALERFEKLDDRDASARLGSNAARIAMLIPGYATEAERLVQKSLRVAETASAEVRLAVLYNAATIAQETHDYRRAAELSRAELDLSRETGHRAKEVEAHRTLGVALWGCWHISEAIESLRESARLSNELGLKHWFQASACDLGLVLIAAGDFEGGVEWSRRAIAGFRQASTSLPAAAVAAINISEAQYLRGNVDALSKAVEDAASLVAPLTESRFHGTFLQSEGRLLRCRGLFDSSLAKLEEAFSLDHRLGRWEIAAQELDDLALTQLGQDRLYEALGSLRRSEELVCGRERPDGAAHRWIEACVHHAAGNHALARSAVRSAYDAYRSKCGMLRDPKLQSHYEAVPFHRAICLAHDRDEWPRRDTTCVVALPLVR